MVDKPIDVRGAQGPFAAPVSFRWQNRWHAVQAVLDVWPDTGSWWDGEEESLFFRITAAGGKLFELVRDRSGRWRLYRIYD
ncbi:MAG: hypothetical protein A2Y96_02040 [Firmicutes bacterium RBG_13_65_8]|nr:MAG: hypothetical protein A2Y96_02040 [Firmicutes bacterium RBG_13_65_8]